MTIQERRNVALDDTKRNPYVVTCEVQDCNLSMSAPSLHQAAFIQKSHVCPAKTQTIIETAGGTLIMQMWDEIDAVTDKLMIAPTGDLKSYAQGVAYCLALFSDPYFRNAKEVSAEALARWKMRNNQIEYRSTPGYDHFNPAPDVWHPRESAGVKVGSADTPAVTFSPPVPSARPRQVAPRAGYKVLSQEDMQTIKEMHATGMFTVDQLASVKSCPVAQVKEIVG